MIEQTNKGHVASDDICYMLYVDICYMTYDDICYSLLVSCSMLHHMMPYVSLVLTQDNMSFHSSYLW